MKWFTWAAAVAMLCAAAAYSEGRLTYNATESSIGAPADWSYTSFIDDSGHANVKEIVPFNNGSATPVGNGSHRFSTNTNAVDGLNLLGSRFGGRLRGDVLSVRTTNHNAGATSHCDYKVFKWDDASFPLVDLTVIAPTTFWTLCGGEVAVGTLGGNSGGVGDTIIDGRSEGYAVSLTDCECLDPECFLMVVGTDRDGTNLCTVAVDTIVSIAGKELF